jgi:aspartate aminotransferase-like enzyme
MYKKLFIPGPTDVDPSVLEKMATPMIGHRTAEATELQKSISEKLQKLMYTDDTILLSTSSGTGLMEGSIRSCTRKRAAVFSVGAFGNRWHQLATANNVPADIFKSEPGQPTTPEMVDEVLKTGKYDVVTVTHNETSSGVVNPCKEIGDVIRKYDDVLYLVDAVSSLGGDKVEVDAWGIDCCITSTQKCLALPPGLSLCSISERALKAAGVLRTSMPFSSA